MAKLDSFSDLTKPQENLLRKNFCFGQGVAVGIYAREGGMSFKSSVKGLVGSWNGTSALAYFQYKTPCLTLKQEVGNVPVFKSTVEYVNEKNPDFKTKFEAVGRPNENLQKFCLTGEVNKEKYRAKFSVTDELCMKISSVFGNCGFGAGFEASFDTGSFKMDTYNAALWTCRNDNKLVVKVLNCNKSCGFARNVVFSACFNCFAGKKIGASLNFDGTGARSQVAFEKQLKDGSIFKTRFGGNGMIGFALRTKINDLVSVVTASEFKMRDSSFSPKFGLKLKINQ